MSMSDNTPKPRKSRSKYNAAKHGVSHRMGGLPAGYMIFKQDVDVQVHRPKQTESGLKFTAWPTMDENDPRKLAPARFSTEPHDFSEWLVRFRTAAYVGTSDAPIKYTWCLYEPWNEEFGAENVYIRFYNACKKAKKNAKFGPGMKWDSEWNRLIGEDGGKETALSKPKYLSLVQATVFSNGRKDYLKDRAVPLGLDPTDSLQVVELSSAAQSGIYELCCVEKDDPQGDLARFPHRAFKYGDPTGIPQDGGKTRLGTSIFNVFYPNEESPVGYEEDSTFDGDLEAEFLGYAVQRLRHTTSRSNTKVKITGDLDEEKLAVAKSKMKWWWDDYDDDGAVYQEGLIRVPSQEEQALFIAKGLASVPKLVEYAMPPEYLTNDVLGVLRKRRSAAVPEMPEYADDDEDVNPRRRSRRNATKDETIDHDVVQEEVLYDDEVAYVDPDEEIFDDEDDAGGPAEDSSPELYDEEEVYDEEVYDEEAEVDEDPAVATEAAVEPEPEADGVDVYDDEEPPFDVNTDDEEVFDDDDDDLGLAEGETSGAEADATAEAEEPGEDLEDALAESMEEAKKAVEAQVAADKKAIEAGKAAAMAKRRSAVQAPTKAAGSKAAPGKQTSAAKAGSKPASKTEKKPGTTVGTKRRPPRQ